MDRKCVSRGSTQKSNGPSFSVPSRADRPTFSQGVAGFIGPLPTEFSISQQLYVLSIPAFFNLSSFARRMGMAIRRPFLLDGSVKKDWWNTVQQKKKKKKKKNTGEIPSMPSPSADLWEVIKILRRYHAVGTHGYARRKGWKIAFWNWPDDWMGWRWRGQLKLAMLKGENRDGSLYW